MEAEELRPEFTWAGGKKTDSMAEEGDSVRNDWRGMCIFGRGRLVRSEIESVTTRSVKAYNH